jgi:LAS superfamily LD-carboxypeptidase LdcB
MLWKKFNALTIQMRRETGKNIRIVSGYRAPAYQSVLFLKELYLHNFDLNITKSVIKLPGKSEHQNYEDMAIDLGNIRHRLLEDDVIYQWLEENANSFGFYNSYPKKTLPSKMQFEPWHWNFKVIQ